MGSYALVDRRRRSVHVNHNAALPHEVPIGGSNNRAPARSEQDRLTMKEFLQDARLPVSKRILAFNFEYRTNFNARYTDNFDIRIKKRAINLLGKNLTNR